MLKIVFLGTSSMVPTKQRSPASVYIEQQGEGLLVDCGEGAQRQMNIVGIPRSKVKHIFITHWHADHTAGLIGLIQTLSNKDKDIMLTIHGPIGTKECMEHVIKSSVFDQQIHLDVHDHNCTTPHVIAQTKQFRIEAVNLHHSTRVLGYSFIQHDRRRVKVAELTKLGVPQGPLFARLQNGEDIEYKGKSISHQSVTTLVKGKKITLITDTLFCQQAIDLAQDAQLLICEATYAASHAELAHSHKHMTSEQAAQIASMANVKQLYLTHFSQRYKDLTQLHQDACDIFPNTQLANDLQVVKL